MIIVSRKRDNGRAIIRSAKIAAYGALIIIVNCSTLNDPRFDMVNAPSHSATRVKFPPGACLVNKSANLANFTMVVKFFAGKDFAH